MSIKSKRSGAKKILSFIVFDALQFCLYGAYIRSARPEVIFDATAHNDTAFYVCMEGYKNPFMSVILTAQQIVLNTSNWKSGGHLIDVIALSNSRPSTSASVHHLLIHTQAEGFMHQIDVLACELNALFQAFWHACVDTERVLVCLP